MTLLQHQLAAIIRDRASNRTHKMALNTDHIKWFRDSSPYIDAHRDKTFVVCIASDALQSENFPKVISDIALLNSLGAKVVVVFGGDHQVKAVLEATGSSWLQDGDQRITTAAQIEAVTSVLGQMYADLSARFSASTPESPAKRRRSRPAQEILSGHNLWESKMALITSCQVWLEVSTRAQSGTSFPADRSF